LNRCEAALNLKAMHSLLLTGLLTLVSLNCENLFDCQHDSLKNDLEWTPEGTNHWTRTRYWHKLNNIGREILACGELTNSGWDGSEGDFQLPDLVALCEVENDSVLFDLSKRSLLRNAKYEYVMTNSPDPRGIDVALLYSPFSFRLLHHHSLHVEPLKDMHPTRNILYVTGLLASGDTLHVFVVHAPSRFGGEKHSRPNRQIVADRVMGVVRQLSAEAKVIIAGDFNDGATDPALRFLEDNGLHNVTAKATGSHGAKATYRYQGVWQSIDHVFVSPVLLNSVEQSFINDAPFLLEEDKKYGGVKPLRTYNGYRYQRGFSDHLPLVVRFRH
jgi:endonuclease/exonuclease/phosphatase family metal-dependent hydrolase